MGWATYPSAADGSAQFAARAMTEAEAASYIAAPREVDDLADEDGSDLTTVGAKWVLWPLTAAVLYLLNKVKTLANQANGVLRLDSNAYLGGAVLSRFLYPPLTKTANYTALAGDQVILVDSTAGAVTITLPTTGPAGKIYHVKDWKGQAGVNNITLAASGGLTIDGGASVVLSANYAKVTVMSDGANWTVIG